MKNNSRLGRRRSQRLTLSMPVVVSESQANPQQPTERARTLSVSRHGGLIELRANVNWGQSLMLTNPFSRVSQECRVVYVGPAQQESRPVGVEFLGEVTNFWNISFPAPVPGSALAATA